MRWAVIAALAVAAIVGPSLAKAQKDDAGPPVPELEFVFEAVVTLEPTVEVGHTPYGLRRRIPINGGIVDGPRLHGKC